MKVMVMPIGLELGGSEINAVELAASVRSRGNDVFIVGRPGPLGPVARDLGLPVRDANIPARGRPRPEATWSLSRIIREERPDLIHVYEAPSCTEAFFAAGWRNRIPVVATIYSMTVDGFMPRAVPTIAGTAQIQAALRATRNPATVHRLEPPIDTVRNSPDEASGRRQRQDWRVRDDEDLVVIVSRLDVWMKMDSLMDTIDAVGVLAAHRPLRLAVVGDGPAREALTFRASEVNRRHGREVVTMAGPMLDPVPAYRAADVIVGMGTSVLRGMAVGKPTILAGELGHVQAIAPSTVEPLLSQGFWGVGDGRRATERLATLITDALELDPRSRGDLGAWGRGLVDQRFGLDSSTSRLMGIYEEVLHWSPGSSELLGEFARVPVAIAARKLRDRAPGRRSGVRALRSPARMTDSYQTAQAWVGSGVAGPASAGAPPGARSNDPAAGVR